MMEQISFTIPKDMNELGLSINDNSPEDILGLTNDMLNFIQGKSTSKETQNWQKIFKDRYYLGNIDRHDAGNLAPSFIETHFKLFSINTSKC